MVKVFIRTLYMSGARQKKVNPDVFKCRAVSLANLTPSRLSQHVLQYDAVGALGSLSSVRPSNAHPPGVYFFASSGRRFIPTRLTASPRVADFEYGRGAFRRVLCEE